MISSSSIWIYTTLGLGVTTVIAILFAVAEWHFARKEGRHFIKRGFGGGGVDLIRHQPLSNKISLTNLKWVQDVWVLGKEAMFFSFDKILNPRNPQDNLFNKLISESSTWAGSKRPAVIATDVLSFAVTPALYAAIAKAENQAKYKEIKPILDTIKNITDEDGVPEIDTVSFLEIISPENLKKYLKDLGPKKMREMFLKGVEAQKLANTRPPKEGGLAGSWIAIIVVGFMAGAILVYVLITSGMLKGFV